MAAFSPTEHEREDIISSLKTYNQQITTVIDKANDDVIPSLNKVELKSAEIELHSILFQSIPYLVTCYRSMGIKTSKDFYTHPTIVQSKEVENLMKIMGTLTDRYHEALRNVDDVLSHESTKGIHTVDSR